MTRQRRYLPFLLMASAALGCPPGGATWVEPESTLTDLVFGVATRRGGNEPVQFTTFRVDECDARSLSEPLDTVGLAWLLVDTLIGGHEYPSRLRYGEVPVGFKSFHGPNLLAVGCYVANSGRGARVRFYVDSTGRLESESRP